MQSRLDRYFILCLLLVAGTGCTINPALTLPDDPRSMDIANLTTPDSSIAQADVFWIPFVHFKLSGIGVSERVQQTFPPGHCLINVDVWGPFGILATEYRRAWFDDANAFYEDSSHATVLWGLVHRTKSLIRVPTGYRREVHTRLLWLLHFGPFIRYESDAEAPEPAQTTAAVTVQ